MTQKQSRRSLPLVHILMGVSGWVWYLFQPHNAVAALAIILSLLALPRLIRGPKERAITRVSDRLRRPHRPSRRTAKHLLAEEIFLMEVHEHPVSLLLWWLGGIAWSTAAGAIAYFWLWQVALVFWAVGAIPFFIRVILWRVNRICLTDKRIFAVHGLIHLTVAAIPLKKVTDKSFTIPWHSALLTWLRLVKTEYGKMALETAGEGTKLTNIVQVPHVVEVNKLIMKYALG